MYIRERFEFTQCPHLVERGRVPQLVEVGVVRVAESQVVPGADAAVSRGRVEHAQPVGEALSVIQEERGAGGAVVALAPEVHALQLVGPGVLRVKLDVQEIALVRGREGLQMGP